MGKVRRNPGLQLKRLTRGDICAAVTTLEEKKSQSVRSKPTAGLSADFLGSSLRKSFYFEPCVEKKEKQKKGMSLNGALNSITWSLTLFINNLT